MVLESIDEVDIDGEDGRISKSWVSCGSTSEDGDDGGGVVIISRRSVDEPAI
jgi:hypothetical protein